MPLGEPFEPQPPAELIMAQWMRENGIKKNLQSYKLPNCIHVMVCRHVDVNRYCFHTIKGIVCPHYCASHSSAKKSEAVLEELLKKYQIEYEKHKFDYDSFRYEGVCDGILLSQRELRQQECEQG